MSLTEAEDREPGIESIQFSNDGLWFLSARFLDSQSSANLRKALEGSISHVQSKIGTVSKRGASIG